MQIRFMNIILLLLYLIRIGFTDELLAARCNSKCLHDFETSSQTDNQLRRHLKHQLINLCKENANCSSCSLPCQETFDSIDNCKRVICKDAEKKSNCHASCEYLQQIFTEKPGHCPRSSTTLPSDECSATCHLDGDCLETEKCCTVGCSRHCRKAISMDHRLISIPTAITVKERKRRRSVIIRWVVQQMSREQTNTNSNLYVLQWRWSIYKNEDTMTDWQTIMVRNKLYAILKHLLTPGRYYMFRLAAVNVHGSLGFSNSSPPFKLSKEPRAPGQPRNLTLGANTEDSQGFWSQELHWNPPVSELPIKNYILSWYKSTEERAEAYEEALKRTQFMEKQGKRSTMQEEEEDIYGDDFISKEHSSTIISSYRTFSAIDGLERDTTYLIEVHASVDSSDGELHGEKAIIFVRTPRLSTRKPKILTGDVENQTATSLIYPTHTQRINMALEIKPPYYEDDTLKTAISWLNSKFCASQETTFILRWKLMACDLEGSKKRAYYDLDTSGRDWAEIRIKECVAIIDDLNFSCSYFVEVKRYTDDQIIAGGHFETTTCEKTPAASVKICEQTEFLPEILCSVNTLEASAFCEWKIVRAEDSSKTVIGYRILLSVPRRSFSKLIINPPQAQNIKFKDLELNTDYSLHVQVITDSGPGSTLITSFNSGIETEVLNQSESNIDSGRNGPEKPSIAEQDLINVNKFPGQEIVELPLNNAVLLRWFSLCLVAQFYFVYYYGL